MKAARLEAIGEFHVRAVETPSPGPDELLVRVEAAGICGTDRHLLHGTFPCRPPVTLGHEFSGIVEAVGEAVIDFRPGMRITGNPNIHCGRCVRPGGSVIVLGGGVIGMLVVQLARLAGATSVVLVTRQAARRQLAEATGATASFDPGNGNVIEGIGGPDGLLPGGADVVIECAGVAETMADAPKLARNGGTVVILGVMPQGETVAIEPFDLLFREVRVLTAFLNPDTHARAAALIAEGTIRVKPLISRRIGLDALPDALANPPRPGEVKVLVMPGRRD